MFNYGDIVDGVPSRIVEEVPATARGKIITAVNRDPEMLAKGRVEILTAEGKRYWLKDGTARMVLPRNPSFPEHEKLTKIRAQSQSIGEFLAWATSEKGFQFGQEVPIEPVALSEDADNFERHAHSLGLLASTKSVLRQAGELTVKDLLAEFFGIDETKLEEEKRLMLEYLRHGGTD